MSNPLAQAHDRVPGSDRRLYSRKTIPSLAYVELDEGNGGIVLNVSEGGLAVQAVMSLMDDVLPSVRFQLSESDGWIRANARITWTGQSRKLAGLEFVGLPDDARGRIKEWLIREALPPGAALEASAASKETPEENESPTEAPETHEGAVSTAPLVEQGSVAEDRGPVAAAPFEVGISIPSAPIPEGVSHPATDAFARILGHAHETEPESRAHSADAKPLTAEKLIANRGAAVAVLLLLAVASLAAGWSAGQGKLGNFVRRFQGITSQNGPADLEPASASTIPAARISEIEVVNASGERWAVPFNGPVGNPGDAARKQAYGGTSSQANKPQTGFRTWILAPPQQTRAAADDAGLARENPPVLADAPASAADGVLTTSGAINSHGLAGPPSLRVPDPPPPTGVVKQGQLIRRVDPDYPAIAREQHAEGIVRLNVTVGPDGIVRGISVLGGPRLLLDAAESAVRQWRYSPTTIDGKPIEFQREVDLTFHLSNASR
jgi:TonB family protein